ncbi:MAG: cysteine desulfurase [Ruminococcaceae bacterium]|nr:cysteine desulfurase [Oscillospiraceae bacterium]
MKTIYLDNSATTALSPTVRQAMLAAFDCYGNPSSLHSIGQSAERMMEEARSTIAEALFLPPRDYKIIFTSGGTEANNLALFGTLHAKKYSNARIVITDSEHPCIMEPAKALEAEGVEVIRLSTRKGCIDPGEMLDAINHRTVLLSIMHVNNETGAIYDIPNLFRLAKKQKPDLICHTDAVQAFLKIPFRPERCLCDLVSISSHKIHGPKGAGALVVHKDILQKRNLVPILLGGGQENNLRSGTENTISIAGFGAAAREGIHFLKENHAKMDHLREYLITHLPNEVRPNLPPKAACHILNITLPQIKSETMLHFLSSNGIYVSSGSACSSHGKHGSYVLSAFGLTEKEADTSIRISLNPTLTEDDLNYFLEKLGEGIHSLVTIR